MIPLDINPEVEERFIRQATEHGLDAAAYAAKIVTESVCLPVPKTLSSADFKRFLDELVIPIDRAPRLPDEAYSRQSFYEDHG